MPARWHTHRWQLVLEQDPRWPANPHALRSAVVCRVCGARS